MIKAKQQLTHLYLGLWKECLHQFLTTATNLSITPTYKRKQLLNKLAEWKRNSSSLMGVHQAYLANYDLNNLSTWQTSSMTARIKILILVARNLRKSCTVGQTLFTAYFPPTNQPLQERSHSQLPCAQPLTQTGNESPVLNPIIQPTVQPFISTNLTQKQNTCKSQPIVQCGAHNWLNSAAQRDAC